MLAGRLRIALPRISFGGGEGGSLTAVYVVYTLILFAVFVLVNFPYDVVVQRVLERVSSPAFRVEAGSARFAFFRGVEIRNLRIPQPGQTDAPPWFEARSLYVRPAWSHLLRGDFRMIALHGIAYNGTIDANLRAGSELNRASIVFDSLNVARYAPLTVALGNGELQGMFSGSIDLEMRGTSLDAAHASATVRMDNALARGVTTIAKLTLPELTGCFGNLKLEMKDGKIDVQEGSLECDQIKLSGAGTVQPKQSAEDTVVNLRYQMQPGAKSTKEWELLTAVAGCGVSGTLGKLKPERCAKAPKK